MKEKNQQAAHKGGRAIAQECTEAQLLESEPRIETDGVHIPTFDPATGYPTGNEEIIDFADRDLMQYAPWYDGGEGAYTIQRVLGTTFRCYLYACLNARFSGCAVVARQLGPVHPEGNDLD